MNPFCLGLLLLAQPEPPPPTLDEVIAYLGFGARARADILRGKIISVDFRESAEEELAVALSMLVPAALPRAYDEVRLGRTYHTDPDVVSFRDLGDQPPRLEDFAGLEFTAADAAEVRDLLKAEPGSQFNLSLAEIEVFRSLGRRFPARGAERTAECLRAVNEAYQRLLLERCRAYREEGLAAVAPYARQGGKETRPGESLRRAAAEARLLAERFPLFYRAFTGHPKSPARVLEHHYYWVKQKVEGRPTFILAHRVFYLRPDAGLMAQRQFYVGSSYDSLQSVVIALPLDGSTAVFYTNRTFTDQVTGFASGLRHSVGRGRMRDKITVNFEEIRRVLKAGAGGKP